MRITRAWALVVALLIVSPLWAAKTSSWEAGSPVKSDGIRVLRGPQSAWSVTVKNGVYVADLPPSHDYYGRSQILVRINRSVGAPAWLVVGYLDDGYGLISITLDSAGQTSAPWTDQWDVARLNTGRIRHAVFRLDHPPLQSALNSKDVSLRIAGVQFLHDLSLRAAKPAIEPVPDVEPAIRFTRYGQRVINIGSDTKTVEQLPEGLAALRNMLPLARALGFNGIESYVKWNFVERQPGVYDWSYYDAEVKEIQKYGLHWFPLLIVGSAYTLPAWYYNSKKNVGFECLEHHETNAIQSIFVDNQDPYVERFLNEFAKHYASRKVLLGLRLGPSGNYGEAQYPATGELGYDDQPIHTHKGYWAGGPYASQAFQRWLEVQYESIGALDKAWGDHFTSFGQIQTFLPRTAATRRKRLDFGQWYMDAMSAWCAQWARWARAAMPHASIYQSSGGWGALDIGTDYTAQAKTMGELKGGIRLTNESDNFAQNFAITRMASSAARFYGADLGYEPGGFGSGRGVAARIFNAAANGAQHLFYYHTNIDGNDQGTEAWLSYSPFLDQRDKPMVDVAAFYPDTSSMLHDEALRYMWGSAFLTRAEQMRSVTDFDYASEQMILDGALNRYKALVFLWGYITTKPVLERINEWVHSGGVLIYPLRPRPLLQTVDGDQSISRSWERGDTGHGRVIFYHGDPEPPEYYARFVRRQLLQLRQLRPPIHQALEIQKPWEAYWSVLENGHLALLNFTGRNATVRLANGNTDRLKPYSMVIKASW